MQRNKQNEFWSEGAQICGQRTCIFHNNPTGFLFFRLDGLLPVFIFLRIKSFLLFNRGLPIPLARARSTQTPRHLFAPRILVTVRRTRLEKNRPRILHDSVPITVFLLSYYYIFAVLFQSLSIYIYISFVFSAVFQPLTWDFFSKAATRCGDDVPGELAETPKYRNVDETETTAGTKRRERK